MPDTSSPNASYLTRDNIERPERTNLEEFVAEANLAAAAEMAERLGVYSITPIEPVEEEE